MTFDDVRDYEPTQEAVVRLLPEIESLDGRIQDEVTRIFAEEVPSYFWFARSSEDYHPPDERGLSGLWLHTKRVYTAYRFLEPTYRAMDLLGPYQATCARAAVLLHDAFKYGQHPADRSNGDDDDAPTHAYADDQLSHLPQYTVTDHDVVMQSFIESDTELPNEVARYVASHGGSGDWYGHDGPTPSTGPEMIVHLADVFATNMEHKLPVYKPGRVLRRVFGSELPTISDDEWIQ